MKVKKALPWHSKRRALLYLFTVSGVAQVSFIFLFTHSDR